MEAILPLWTVRCPQLFSRKWFGSFAISLLLSVCLVTAGCSFASFVSAAETDIPVVIQMVTNITNVVAPGVSVSIQAAGGLALASLQILCGTPAVGANKCDPTSLIGQYQLATDTAVKASVLQKIQAALAAVNVHINDMLGLAQGLPASIGAAIVVAVGVVLSTVTLLLQLIPVGMTALLSRGTVKLAAGQYPAKPSQLKKAFNDAIGHQWPAAVVH